MKREEIAKMPAGREMDALIWLLLNNKPLNIFECRHVDGDIQPNAGYPVGHVSPPHYSTDIADAWQIVGNMKEHGFGFALHCGEGWRPMAIFDKEGSENNYVGAETETLAICRAALMTTADE